MNDKGLKKKKRKKAEFERDVNAAEQRQHLGVWACGSNNAQTGLFDL